jgi:hypothetical protein
MKLIHRKGERVQGGDDWAMVEFGVTVAPLASREIDVAYPLVALGNSPVSLESWRGLARSLLRRQDEGQSCGIMTTRRRGQIRGLFTYEVATTVSPLLLCVGHLSVSEPLESMVPWDRLLWSIVELGRENDCAAVHIGLPPERSWLLERWPDPEGLAHPIAVACTVSRALPHERRLEH